MAKASENEAKVCRRGILDRGVKWAPGMSNVSEMRAKSGCGSGFRSEVRMCGVGIACGSAKRTDHDRKSETGEQRVGGSGCQKVREDLDKRRT